MVRGRFRESDTWGYFLRRANLGSVRGRLGDRTVARGLGGDLLSFREAWAATASKKMRREIPLRGARGCDDGRNWAGRVEGEE